MAGPCSRLRVIDFSHTYPGALATMVLADAGAEVIKVEPSGGDPTRRHYASAMWHRGKKSVVLDLKTEEGRAGAQRLAAHADVVVESFRPGVAERQGIGYDALGKANPRLVYCSITGFGSRGPWSRIKAYEGIVHAKAGRMDAFYDMVRKDGPLYTALPVASYGAAMTALHGVLAALLVRERTGLGQQVEASLLQGLTCFDLSNFLAWQVHRRNGAPVARGYAGPVPPFMNARTKDGHWIQFGNLTPNLQWNFLHALGLEHTLAEPRFANMPIFDDPADELAIQRLVWPKMLEKTRDEWMQVFIENDVAAEPFQTTQEGLRHPQAVHQGDVIDVVDPVLGPMRQVGPIGRLSVTPLEPGGPAPGVGQHTREVLASPQRRRRSPARAGGPLPPHPLSGFTVLEFGTYIAVPFAACLLADLGARVIKIEPLTGDLYRVMGFPRVAKTLQGKEGMSMDLKDPRAQQVVHKLVAKADVLVHNYRPGVPERLGIAYSQVRGINPRLVYVYSGAYGATGPHAARAGFHTTAGAITGGPRFELGDFFPDPAEPMTLEQVEAMSYVLRRASEPNPDPAAALATCSAIMLALYARERTGRGQYIETTTLGGNLYANADDAVWFAGKPERALPDKDFNGLHALYRLYRAKEGWVFLGCVQEEEWRRFALASGAANLSHDPRFRTGEQRQRHDGELAAAIGDLLKTRPAAEWERLLVAHDVPCVEVFQGDTGKFFNRTAWLKDAGYWLETHHPSIGRYWRYGPAVTLSKTPGTAGPYVVLGEHTRTILEEMGYGNEAIDGLVRDGVIRCGATDEMLVR